MKAAGTLASLEESSRCGVDFSGWRGADSQGKLVVQPGAVRRGTVLVLGKTENWGVRDAGVGHIIRSPSRLGGAKDSDG